MYEMAVYIAFQDELEKIGFSILDVKKLKGLRKTKQTVRQLSPEEKWIETQLKGKKLQKIKAKPVHYGFIREKPIRAIR